MQILYSYIFLIFLCYRSYKKKKKKEYVTPYIISRTTSRNGKDGQSITSIAYIIDIAFSYVFQQTIYDIHTHAHTRSALVEPPWHWYAAVIRGEERKRTNNNTLTLKRARPLEANMRLPACLPLLPQTVHRPWYDIDARHRSINRLRNKRGRKSRGALVARL